MSNCMLPLAIVAALCLAVYGADPTPPETPFVPSNVANVNKAAKAVDATMPQWSTQKKTLRQERVGLDVQAERAYFKLVDHSNRIGVAGQHNGNAVARATKGKQASAQSFGTGIGGAVQSEKHHGSMSNYNTTGSDEGAHADLKLDNKHNLDTVANGGHGERTDDFDATNDALTLNVNPDRQDKPSETQTARGNGAIHYENENAKKSQYRSGQDYDYTIVSEPRTDKSTVTFKQDNWAGYNCYAVKTGTQNCFDGSGKYKGKTVTQPDGSFKVINEFGIPIYNGKTQKINDTHHRAVFTDKLLEASMTNVEKYDCCSEFGGGSDCNKDIKIENMDYEYEGKSLSGGRHQWKFPDCFQITGDVTLPRGLDPNRIMLQFIANVLPIGKLQCADPGVCADPTRSCLYCDACSSEHKLDILDNSDSNVCTIKNNGGQKLRLRATVCPPPETFKWSNCTNFDKGLFSLTDKRPDSYWNKRGDVDSIIKIFTRALNKDQAKKDFFAKIDNPLLAQITRTTLTFKLIAKLGLSRGTKFTDPELMEFYIRENTKEALVGCTRGVVKYELGSTDDKIDTSFLFEVGTSAAGATNDPFGTPECEELDELLAEQMEADRTNLRANGGGGGGGIFGSGGGIFGGRKRK